MKNIWVNKRRTPDPAWDPASAVWKSRRNARYAVLACSGGLAFLESVADNKDFKGE